MTIHQCPPTVYSEFIKKPMVTIVWYNCCVSDHSNKITELCEKLCIQGGKNTPGLILLWDGASNTITKLLMNEGVDVKFYQDNKHLFTLQDPKSKELKETIEKVEWVNKLNLKWTEVKKDEFFKKSEFVQLFEKANTPSLNSALGDGFGTLGRKKKGKADATTEGKKDDKKDDKKKEEKKKDDKSDDKKKDDKKKDDKKKDDKKKDDKKKEEKNK